MDEFVGVLVNENKSFITTEIVSQFQLAILKLQQRLNEPIEKKFYHFKTIKSHILPLTNVCFNKLGLRFDIFGYC